MPSEEALLTLEVLAIVNVKASFRYELLFDSLVQSAAAGTRNSLVSAVQSAAEGTRTSVVSARQLLFRIGAIFVDVEVGCEAESGRASLIGQMLDSSNPGHPPAGVPIVLLNRGRNIASTSSNDNGEFQLQFAMKRNLKLSVGVDRDSPVCLPITRAPAKTNSIPSELKRAATRSFGSA